MPACVVSQGPGLQLEESDFDATIVCNGHYSELRTPEVAGAGAFPGRQMHSHSYRDNRACAGATVVVVGASASGEDISREIAEVADRVCPLLSRSPCPEKIIARSAMQGRPAVCSPSALFRSSEVSDNLAMPVCRGPANSTGCPGVIATGCMPVDKGQGRVDAWKELL